MFGNKCFFEKNIVTNGIIVGLSLALLAATLTAILGAVFNFVAKKNLPAVSFYTAVSVLSFLGSLALVKWNVLLSGSENRLGQLVLTMAATGILNATQSLLLIKSMKYGHCGTTFLVFQSAMIVPCVSAVFLWGENLSLTQWIGLVAVLGMLSLTTSVKDDSAREGSLVKRKWLLLVLPGFLCVGIVQVFALVPSHWEGWQDEARLRPPLMFLSSALAFMPATILLKQRFNGGIWLPALIAAVCGILFMVCLWGSADIMAGIGMSGIVYPIITADSVVLFGLYSFFVLKEQYQLRQCLGMLLGIAGIVLLGLK